MGVLINEFEIVTPSEGEAAKRRGPSSKDGGPTDGSTGKLVSYCPEQHDIPWSVPEGVSMTVQ